MTLCKSLTEAQQLTDKFTNSNFLAAFNITACANDTAQIIAKVFSCKVAFPVISSV